MKKIFIPLMAASFLFIGFNGTASAQTSNENKNQLNKVTEVKTNSFIDEYGDMVIEKRKYNSENDLIEVSVEKEESAHSNGSVSLQASGAYHANSRATIVGRFEAWSGAPQMRLYANGFSDAYTNSKKTKKKSISRISVSTTLQMSGAIEAQSSDSKKNSSFANASAKQKKFIVPTGYSYSKNSHEYHNTGANSIYHTTSAKR